jgi:serine/threonine protein kinase
MAKFNISANELIRCTQSGEVTCQSDIFGLGGTLLYLFTGKRPFEDHTIEHIAHKVLSHKATTIYENKKSVLEI